MREVEKSRCRIVSKSVWRTNRKTVRASLHTKSNSRSTRSSNLGKDVQVNARELVRVLPSVTDLPLEVEQRNLLGRGRDGSISDRRSHELGRRSSRSGSRRRTGRSTVGSSKVLDNFAVERLDGGLVASRDLGLSLDELPKLGDISLDLLTDQDKKWVSDRRRGETSQPLKCTKNMIQIEDKARRTG